MAEQASCHGCVYAHWDLALWARTVWTGWPAGPVCGNQPDSPGRMKECPIGTVCRNYRARPPVPQGETVKTIPLGEGLYAYVDAADFDWLNQWHWRSRSGYAARYENRNRKQRVIFMHREIKPPPPGKVVDHASGNRYDNTRANLRHVTRRENQHNRRKRVGGSSIYKGVTYHKRNRCWYAYVDGSEERFNLGRFDNEVEAARAYDAKAAEVFGEYARPNFPDEWPPEQRRRAHARWLRQQAKAGGIRKVRTKRRQG